MSQFKVRFFFFFIEQPQVIIEFCYNLFLKKMMYIPRLPRLSCLPRPRSKSLPVVFCFLFFSFSLSLLFTFSYNFISRFHVWLNRLITMASLLIFEKNQLSGILEIFIKCTSFQGLICF